MQFSTYLDHEWKPALGCTEPATVAWGAALAAEQAEGEIQGVELVCDRRIYKNSFAAGLPHSGGRTGIEWAAALGAVLPDASCGLEGLRRLDPERLEAARRLILAGAVRVEVLGDRDDLLVDCRVRREGGEGRAVIGGTHTALVRLERDGESQPLPTGAGGGPEEERFAAWLDALELSGCLELAAAIDDGSRARLDEGRQLNLEIAHHGLELLPESFRAASRGDRRAEVANLVCGGVFARMGGVDRTVMTLAGSGNKGITVAVALACWAEELGVSSELADEALALAALVTSVTTRRLGTLSAMCGCANAAGMGLAAGLVRLHGGGERELELAVGNLVGTVTGVICDGAKVGCGLKATTAVDTAHRAASLALSGFGVSAGDGIVAARGEGSLDNLERIARQGLRSMDAEVLAILRETPRNGAPGGR